VGYVIGGEQIGGISQWHDVRLGRDVVGVATEAVYSPRLEKNIAVGMLASEVAADVRGLETDFGDGPRPASVASLPFG
jgi:aminomethyltransferase